MTFKRTQTFQLRTLFSICDHGLQVFSGNTFTLCSNNFFSVGVWIESSCKKIMLFCFQNCLTYYVCENIVLVIEKNFYKFSASALDNSKYIQYSMHIVTTEQISVVLSKWARIVDFLSKDKEPCHHGTGAMGALAFATLRKGCFGIRKSINTQHPLYQNPNKVPDF